MKILLATDGSQYSELAAKFLRCLHLSFDDQITIFHAVYWIPFLYDKESYFSALKSIKEEIAPKVIDSVLTILKDMPVKISTAIIDGSPEQCIVDIAAESDMDLIVMGARGVKGIKSFFIGSVTNAVALHASKPVFITKPPGCHQAENLKLLFATDGSDHSIATEKILSEIPFPENTEITIVNVTSPVSSDMPQTFVPGINEKILDLAKQTKKIEGMTSENIIEQACEHLTGSFKNINILSKEGDVPTEILKASEELKTDIIAVGCRGLSGLKGMMGSASRNILTHSKCSVLIGKTSQ
jgi:nucleotide-binding universal stress UspA family protein